MAKHKLTISFRRQYKHIYEHLLRQPNRSDYVCRLIEADMNKKGEISEEEIGKVIMEILKGKGNSDWALKLDSENQLSKEDVDLIKDLF